MKHNQHKSKRTHLTILETLFPRVRAEILRTLFMAPKKRKHLRQLARLSDASPGTIHEELATLTAAGILENVSNGYHRFYWPNQQHPLFLPLLQIVHSSGRSRRVNISDTRRIQRGTVKRRKPRIAPTYYSGRPYPLNWGIMSRRDK